ncbi:MAG TPA: glutaredoxin family protein [Gammaproteobacteria bacterium]|nr:glutaredoxin family protein [Gammaproteobacteria bacterium]
MSIHLILYGTDGCHLCDQASELLARPLAEGRITVTNTDILDDPALEERYGIRIPVVQDAASRQELGWPFDLDQLEEFLAQLPGR